MNQQAHTPDLTEPTIERGAEGGTVTEEAPAGMEMGGGTDGVEPAPDDPGAE